MIKDEEGPKRHFLNAQSSFILGCTYGVGAGNADANPSSPGSSAHTCTVLKQKWESIAGVKGTL